MVRAEQVDVTNNATLLVNAKDSDGASVLVNNRAAVAIFVGGADVTVGEGYELPVGAAPLAADLATDEDLYARAATAGPHRVDVLRTRVA